MSRTVRTVATTALVATAPAGVVLARLAAPGHVPDPLPTHWDLHGRVDDTVALGTLFGACLLVSVACAALTLVTALRSREDRADRALVALGGFATWLAALVFVAPVWVSYGADDAAGVHLDLLGLLAVPLLPTLAAALVWRLQPVRLQPRPAPAGRCTLRLREGERVTWVGRSSSVPMAAAAAVLLVAAVFLVFTAWPVANVLALVALAVFWTHVVTVRVDDRAVTVAWGPARWPRLTVPIDDLAGVRAEEIEPLSWGGWGYRVTRRGRAVVTRRGPGVVLEHRDGSELAVTVDGAAGVADLVDRRARTAR